MSNTDAPVRTVSELLPGDTAQAAAANAFARALLLPQSMLNTVGAQVNLCTLLLSGAMKAPFGMKKRNPRRRGITLLVRPMRKRSHRPSGSLAPKPSVLPGDAVKSPSGEGRDAAPAK